MYWIPVIISLLITLIAQIHVRSAFSRYSKIGNSRGLTGAEAARQMLLENGITDVTIEPIPGSLTDHYDPRTNTIRLSQDVYNVSSVAAVGVAMHEAGHALQYATGYAPIRLRNAIVKSTNISSWVSYFLVMLGILCSSYELLTFGIIAFCVVVFFQIVTLPVEFNASSRAVKTLKAGGWLQEEEIKGAKEMLSAAAMTYVAAVAVSLLHLLRLLAIRGNRR
ncbi:MAG: zinc metallopeptidase [Oscillospiraceae bacterium]|nr:zinc metallopeptidase [Oscillospiraceae bacterium]